MGRGKVIVIACVVVYAWWATSLRPFTTPSLVAVLAAGVVAVVAGSRQRTRDRVVPAASRVVPWAVLAVALGAWQLAAYFHNPRSDHPTLSSLADTALDVTPLRGAAFAAWVWGAAALARR